MYMALCITSEIHTVVLKREDVTEIYEEVRGQHCNGHPIYKGTGCDEYLYYANVWKSSTIVGDPSGRPLRTCATSPTTGANLKLEGCYMHEEFVCTFEECSGIKL